MNEANEPETLIRRAEVARRTGMQRSTLYSAIARGDFPKPVKISERAVGWIESEVNAWVAKRIAASRAEKAA